MPLHRLPVGAALLVAACLPASAAPASSLGPSAPYRSAFEGYRNHRDAAPIPWREANDTVRGIGGWKAYAREAQAGPAVSPAAPSSAPASSPPSSPSSSPSPASSPASSPAKDAAHSLHRHTAP